MKRLVPVLLILCLCLTGCGQPIPVQAADGAPWNDDWVTVGGIIGVDTPAGITHQENNDSLSIKGMYYATWSIGEAEPYVNDDGNEAQLYDAQIYLLLAGYDGAEKAEESTAEWEAIANDHYAVEQTMPVTCGGLEFTLLTYTYVSETNPYARGASAFGVYRNYAINVEVSCREGFAGSPQEILSDFLEHCHYSI